MYRRLLIVFLALSLTACPWGKDKDKDAGPPPSPDQGVHPVDDAAPPVTDTLPPDQAVPTPDLPPPTLDQAVVTPDLPPPTPDQAVVTPDQAVVTPDQAVVTPDQAVVTPDQTVPDQTVVQPDTCAVPCNGTCCQGSEQCLFGGCVVPGGACVTNADCLNDTYCFNKLCIPWGVGPGGTHNAQCKSVPKPADFNPALQCAWTGPPGGDAYPNHKNVLSTPMVVDFGIPGMNGSVVFVSYNLTDGGGPSARCDGGAHGVIRVIRGKDCKQMYTVAGVKVRGGDPLALGDLDGDKIADIVGHRCGGGLIAARYDKTTDKFVQMWTSSPATMGAKDILWSGPSIHDLDNDGVPEVLMGGYVFDNKGKLLDGSLGMLPVPQRWGGFSVVADVDADGKAELVTGAAVYEWDIAMKKWKVQNQSATLGRGLVAVADFGTFGANPANDDRTKLDGIAEVAVVFSGSMRVQTVGGRVVFGPVKLPATSQGGAPTVGDFDNDGRAEVACAGRGSYTVFDPDCKAGATKATCASFSNSGILWSRPSQDHSSSSSGSSIFDFDGDGKAEAIYADECFTRVYEGTSGEVIFSRYRTSCTWYENPVVADVDGDGNSELVVPANVNCGYFEKCSKNPLHPKLPGTALVMDPLFRGLRCKKAKDCPGGTCDSGYCRCTTDTHCGGGSYRCGPMVVGTPGKGNVCRSVLLGPAAGVQIYRDMKDSWVGSRPIWNQHAYSVTNINDDGTIPKTGDRKKNWTTKGLNNFRQNKQGKLQAAGFPDLTSKLSVTCIAGGVEAKVKVCNRGAKAAPPKINVAVYIGGTPACSAKTTGALPAGTCTNVSCTIKPKPAGVIDLKAVADDDGTGAGAVWECNGTNNGSVFKGLSCP